MLLPQSFLVLNKVAEALKESPTLRVEISGHTDNVGVAAQNQTLSQQRAETVKTYLESKGVEAARLSAVGLGSSRPIGDNNTEAGRAQNRRVELRVLPAAPADTGIPVVPSAVPSVVPSDPAAPAVPAPPTPPAAPLLPGEPNPTAPPIPPPPAIPTAPAAPIAPNVQAPASLGAPSPPPVPIPPPVAPLPPAVPAGG